MHELRFGLRLIQSHDIEEARLERHLDQASGKSRLLDLEEIARGFIGSHDAVFRVKQDRHHRGVLEQLRKQIPSRKVRL